LDSFHYARFVKSQKVLRPGAPPTPDCTRSQRGVGFKFVKAARTIRRHFDGVIAFVKTRLTNGLVEGLNNKLRMIARRAFGFHSADALIAMLFLNSGGIQLDPPPPEIHPLEL
jgi:hypothetical protein